jgi:hypothetical protein
MTGLAILAALSLASNASGKTLVRAQQGTMVPVTTSTVRAYLPFGIPGCYPSGSSMGKGGTITFARAGTEVCTGVGTCQANELCVDSSGASLGTGKTLSIAFPFPAIPAQFCIVGTFQPPGAWSGDWVLFAAGSYGSANSAGVNVYTNGNVYGAIYGGDGSVSAPGTAVPSPGESDTVGVSLSAGVPTLITRGTTIGPGTAKTWSALPATLTIGSDGSGARFFAGHLRDFKVSTRCP